MTNFITRNIFSYVYYFNVLSLFYILLVTVRCVIVWLNKFYFTLVY